MMLHAILTLFVVWGGLGAFAFAWLQRVSWKVACNRCAVLQDAILELQSATKTQARTITELQQARECAETQLNDLKARLLCRQLVSTLQYQVVSYVLAPTNPYQIRNVWLTHLQSRINGLPTGQGDAACQRLTTVVKRLEHYGLPSTTDWTWESLTQLLRPFRLNGDSVAHPTLPTDPSEMYAAVQDMPFVSPSQKETLTRVCHLISEFRQPNFGQTARTFWQKKVPEKSN